MKWQKRSFIQLVLLGLVKQILILNQDNVAPFGNWLAIFFLRFPI